MKKFEKIEMGHGSGGRKSRALISSLFLRHWENPFLESLGDSALLNRERQNLHFTTDSYVVRPIFFPGGDIGKLAVSGTVNDLAVSGAVPKFLSASFILEEGLPLSDLERIVLSMKAAASQAKVLLVAGDTKVVEKGSCDRVFITTSGIGVRHPSFRGGLDTIRPGDAVLVNGEIGSHGVAVLLAREDFPFEAKVESDCAPIAGLISRVLEKANVRFMRDLTRGGLGVILNEIVEGRRFGIRIDEDAIPLNRAVSSFCELVGFDPIYIANEGKAAFIVAGKDRERALKALTSHPLGKRSRVIGEVIEEYPGRVVLRTAVGGLRLVDVPEADQLPRIC